MRKNYDEGKWLGVASLVIQRESPKKTIDKVFEGDQGVMMPLEKLVFKSPLHPFCYR